MEIKACRYCRYGDECVLWNKSYEHPQNEDIIKKRIFDLFVNGYDCFILGSNDEE